MRRAVFATLLLTSGASCATTPSAPVVSTRPESGFRLVETASPTPVAETPDPQQPQSVEVASGPAEPAADVLPVAWQDELPPPAPAPVDGEGTPPPIPVPDEQVPGEAVELTLDAAIGMALAANPTLGEAEYAVRRSQGEWTQVGLYPNPVVGYMASEMGQEDQVGQQGIFAQQTIVTGDKLDLNRAVSSGDIAAARAIAEAQRLRVQTDVQVRFYEALGAQRLVDIAERTELNAAKSLEATRRLKAAGESAQPDVLLAQADIGRMRIARQQAEVEAKAAKRRLAVMIGRPDLSSVSLDGDLKTPRRPEDFEAIWLRVRSMSPELQEASARIARARARIARERATNIPDVDAQLAIQQDAATNYTIGSAQIGIMLPVHQRNQGAIAAAQAAYCRAVKEYERLELDLRDRLAQAVRDAEVAAQQVETFGTVVVPAAEENLELIRAGYPGQFGVLRLVTAQQTLSDALRDSVQAQIDLQRSLAVLDGLLLTGGLEEPNTPQGVDTPDTLTEVPKAQ